MSKTQTKEYGAVKVSDDGRMAYLPGTKAAVFIGNSKSILAPTDAAPKEIVVKGKKEMPKMVPWGEDNLFPQELVRKVRVSPVMSANHFFNTSASFGEGVWPVVMLPVGLKKVAVPLYNAEIYIADLIDKSSDRAKKIYQTILDDILKCKDEVEQFFNEDNDTDGYLLESLTDLHWFFNIFPEAIFNKQDGDKWKIVQLKNKEAVFSRYSEMNSDGEIEYHYYCGDWSKTPDEEKNIVTATPVLDFHSPVLDLRERMTIEVKKPIASRQLSYIIPVNMPSPGRNYYQLAPYFSLIESGWYDFGITIPEFKKNIIQNEAIINYIIVLDQDYFTDIFHREKITEEKDKLARIKLEYANLNDFLTKKENNGKSIVTYAKRGFDGKPNPNMSITKLETAKQGGEYIADSEEVTNMMCYAMLVHAGVVGSSPGKNKNISGTEARELFIIKQAILKPFISRVLRPYYVIKAINKWSKYLHFVIPNIELTTLDKNKTGSQSNLEGQE